MIQPAGTRYCLFSMSSTAPHFSDAGQVETYANNSDLQWNAAMKIIGMHKFNGGERIVDYGCGDGKVTNYLLGLTINKVIGFDISSKMIEKAITDYQDERLNFIEGNITTFASEEKFDVVHAGYCLHYDDAELTLKSIFNVLNDGGTALITLPGRFESSLASHSDKLTKSTKWANDFISYESKRKYYNESDFTQLLHDKGFIPIHVKLIIQNVEFDDRQAIQNFYLPVSAHAKFLPEEKRVDFINDLIKAVLAENGLSDQEENLFIPQCTLEVIARKP